MCRGTRSHLFSVLAWVSTCSWTSLWTLRQVRICVEHAKHRASLSQILLGSFFFWQTKSEKESLGTLAYTQIVVVGCMHHEKWVGLGTGVLYWTVRDGGLLQLSPVPFFLEVLENQSFPACHRHPRCKKCVHVKSTRAQVMT